MVMDKEEARQKAREYYAAHREERLEYMRRYRAQNRDRLAANDRARYHADRNGRRTVNLQRNKQWLSELQAVVLGHYGRSCRCCGSKSSLVLDHINGDSVTQLQTVTGRSNTNSVELFRWIINNGFPPGFQTLCRRCNSSKRSGNACRLSHGALRQVVTAGGSVISWRRP